MRILSQIFVLLFFLAVMHTSAVRSAKIRGTALGGWLLMEGFIANLYGTNANIRDEWTFGLYATQTQRQQLANHWSNYFAESDFAAISAAGLTHIRIPIGYWHLCTQAELNAYNEVRERAYHCHRY